MPPIVLVSTLGFPELLQQSAFTFHPDHRSITAVLVKSGHERDASSKDTIGIEVSSREFFNGFSPHVCSLHLDRNTVVRAGIVIFPPSFARRYVGGEMDLKFLLLYMLGLSTSPLSSFTIDQTLEADFPYHACRGTRSIPWRSRMGTLAFS